MTAPIIPAELWPEGAAALVWSAFGFGKWIVAADNAGTWVVERADIPMPAGHDWRVPVMRPTCKDSLPVAPATDLAAAMLAHLVSSGVLGTDGRAYAELQAMIDGQANVRSSSEHIDSLTPVAHKKLQGLQAEGFIVNGVAIFNPTTCRRGLVDYLGYVGWQASEQPSVAPVGVEGLMQLAREWCMSWGEWAHDADPGCAKENAAEAVLRAALTQAIAQQPTKGEGVAGG